MRQGEFRVTLTFDAVPDGTRLRWSEQVRLKGGLRLLTPLVIRLGRRQEQAIWTRMKRQLESGRPALRLTKATADEARQGVPAVLLTGWHAPSRR
jgi:hypothetical protein